MLRGKKIVFYGGSDWWYHNPSSGVQIVQTLAENGNDIIYVNSIPLRMPKPSRSGSHRRYLNKLKSYAKFMRQASENIWVVSPINIPGFSSSRIQSVNRRLLRAQLALAQVIAGWKGESPIIISMTPAGALTITSSAAEKIVYYLCDKFDKFRDIEARKEVERLDREMAKLADGLVCVSKKLHGFYQAIHPRCVYIPHGHNFDLFHSAAMDESPPPNDLTGIDHPIIGYFGSITESNDKEILETIASKRPGWNIVMIGQVVSDYSKLERYPNIHFLGKKKLAELPLYGRHFDACIMNWIMNEWMHFCNPVKAREYLAMGKPVVSVPIPEVVNSLADVVSIASNGEEFIGKIEFEMATDDAQKRQRRIDKVRHDTWRNKVSKISSFIENLPAKNR